MDDGFHGGAGDREWSPVYVWSGVEFSANFRIEIKPGKRKNSFTAEVTADGAWVATVTAADRLTAARAALAVLIPT